MHESAIGTKRTSLFALHMSAIGGKADISRVSSVLSAFAVEQIAKTLAVSLQAPRGNRIGQIYRLRRILAVELCDLGAQFIHAGTQLGERIAVGF